MSGGVRGSLGVVSGGMGGVGDTLFDSEEDSAQKAQITQNKQAKDLI